MPHPFFPPRAKLTIGSIDDLNLEVIAQYNPKELELARTLSWAAHFADNRPDHRRTSITDNDVEYKGGEGRTISIELLFDGFEASTSVEPQMEMLDEMATARADAGPEWERRPHQCVIVWGVAGIRPLVCVIESLTVKYTMFHSDGRPLRGIASLKVREASVARFDRSKAFARVGRDSERRSKLAG